YVLLMLFCMDELPLEPGMGSLTGAIRRVAPFSDDAFEAVTPDRPLELLHGALERFGQQHIGLLDRLCERSASLLERLRQQLSTVERQEVERIERNDAGSPRLVL